jgi:hypothetical protein
MKRQIIVTIILLIATAFVTVVYFNNLNPPGTRTSRIMRTIPNNAALIVEFNNDKSFYDIFTGNKLFNSIIGDSSMTVLDTVRHLLQHPLLEKYFTGQNVFISIHPAQNGKVDLLLTMSAANGFDAAAFEQMGKQPNSGLLITPMLTGGKPGYNIYINKLKKRFYIVNEEDNIYSGSFSKALIDACALYKPLKDKQSFVLLSEQQNANSLANLYINYGQLTPLFGKFFSNNNTDILKNLRLLPAFSALSLNFRSDALMFNGIANLQHDQPGSYLNLFANQQPVVNHLKDIFPSTTAYSISLSVSDTKLFTQDLDDFHTKAGLKKTKDSLFRKIKAETSVNLKTEFNGLLGNEFAIVTTRFFEKLAIVSIKDGSKLRLLLSGVSTMTDENHGQLNYNKLPFFLLGDAFSVFNKPYFIIIDNYLILATSTGELTSYYDTYINRKFLSQNNQYNQFDNLLSGRSNVAFFFHFKNALPILKRDMYPDVYQFFENNEPGWKDYYASSLQFTAADKNFYANFCMRLSTDTTAVKK